MAGSSFSGDTYLRIYLGSTEVAYNDDYNGLGSRITYTAGSSGTYTVRLGCYSSGSCSGTAAWTQ